MKQTLNLARTAATAAAFFFLSGPLIAAEIAPNPEKHTQLFIHKPYEKHINEAAKRFLLSQQIIKAVITVESGWNPKAVSPAGAMGLMQIMPDTYAELKQQYGLRKNAFDPHDNIIAGSGYLKQMYLQFGKKGYLAAYNAGPGRYQSHLKGRALPAETRAYVAKVEAVLDGKSPTIKVEKKANWRASTLFASRENKGQFRLETADFKMAKADINDRLFVSVSTR
ncbi:lytic transglycosylase domain-containing protein [Bartonella sp. LJL80]